MINITNQYFKSQYSFSKSIKEKAEGRGTQSLTDLIWEEFNREMPGEAVLIIKIPEFNEVKNTVVIELGKIVVKLAFENQNLINNFVRLFRRLMTKAAKISFSSKDSDPKDSSAEPSVMFDIRVEKLILDILKEDSFRFLFGINGARLAVQNSGKEVKVDLENVNVYCCHQYSGISFNNCYESYTSEELFTKFANVENIGIDFRADGHGDVNLKVNFRSRDEVCSKESVIVLLPKSVYLLTELMAKLSALQLIIGGKVNQAGDAQTNKRRYRFSEDGDDAKGQREEEEMAEAEEEEDEWEVLCIYEDEVRSMIDLLLIGNLETLVKTKLEQDQLNSHGWKYLQSVSIEFFASNLSILLASHPLELLDKYVDLRLTGLRVHLSRTHKEEALSRSKKEHVLWAMSLGGLNLGDRNSESIFHSVLEMESKPVQLYLEYNRVARRRELESSELLRGVRERRRLSFETEGQMMSLEKTRSVEKEMQAQEGEVESGEGRLTVGATEGLRMMLRVRPLELFVSDSTLQLLQSYTDNIKAVCSLSMAEESGSNQGDDQESPKDLSVEYLFVSDIRISLHTSASSMMTSIKYIPDLDLRFEVSSIPDSSNSTSKTAAKSTPSSSKTICSISTRISPTCRAWWARTCATSRSSRSCSRWCTASACCSSSTAGPTPRSSRAWS